MPSTPYTLTTRPDGSAIMSPATPTGMPTTQPAAPRGRGRPRNKQPMQWETVPARESVPCYRPGAGPTSFRHGLPAHERAVVDAAIGILGRYLGQPGAVLDGPAAVRDYLWLQLANEPRELFGLLWLDSQHRMICFETTSVGTLTQTTVYPREVARAALTHNAANVVLCHCHPSGSPTPSDADCKLTRVLKETLNLVDCRVLDHCIVAGRQVVSMAELGMV